MELLFVLGILAASAALAPVFGADTRTPEILKSPEVGLLSTTK
jgi:hypothetical protein